MPPFPNFSRPDEARVPSRLRAPALGWALVAGIVVLVGAITIVALTEGPVSRGAVLAIGALLGLAALAAAGYGLQASADVTKLRAEAEANRVALRTTLPQLRALWERAPLSIMLFEPNDPEIPVKIIDCNPRACELHGYKREELVGQCVDIIEAKPWTEEWAGGWIAGLRQNKWQEGESQHRRKDGHIFDIEYFTSLIIVDGREMALGMDRDCSARKAAERALRSSEQRWELAIAGSNEGAWDWNIETNTVWYSPRWKGILGFSDAEFTNTHDAWLEHVHPEDLPRVQAALESHLARKTRLYTCEYRMRHKDGHWTWLLARGTAMFGETGCAVRMLGTHTDIDEQKRIEAELRKAKEAAESADRAKSEFLATMSHEIRTPMNGVLGFTNLLLDTPLTAEQRDWLVTIRSSGESLLTLINDILDFSKIESGCMELDPHPTAIGRCVEEVLDLLWSKAREKKLELVHCIDPEVPAWILTDGPRIRQILINLVGNAIKFTAAGEVEVRVGVAAPVAEGRRARLVFDIRDTGEGIPADRIDRLFRPFSQADSSTTRRFGGTGLGLVISRSLSHLLGGDITLVSTSPAGTCFRLTIESIPTDAPADAGADSAMTPPAAILSGRHVLIVDDNQTNRRVLSTQLERWGLICHACEDPLAAVDYVREHREIDVALLDMMMPDLNGIDLAARLHDLPGCVALPLVLLSSVSREELRAFNPKAHFAVVLTKPVRQSSLLDALHTTLSAARPAPEGSASPAPVAKFTADLGQQHPLRILVAEDNAVNQKLISGLLARLGYQPKFAGNGAACIAALRQDPFDVVLMDCQMPEMDGYEATARIRAGEGGEHHREIHIVALTASAMVGDREYCLQSGMNEYLTKPIQPAELIRLLQEAPTLAV